MAAPVEGPVWARRRHVDAIHLPGAPVLFRLFLPDKSFSHIGWALLVWDEFPVTKRSIITEQVENTGEIEKAALLMHIEIRCDMRRMGLGKSLLWSLQNVYDRIETGPSSNEGRQLCFHCGFRLMKGRSKREVDKLVWKKDFGYGESGGPVAPVEE